MKIKKFFEEDYTNYASYENLRSIASYIDGNYNVKRKIIYTLLSKPQFKMRVDLFSQEVISKSKYIHGSLEDAVVNMTQDYVGSNNLPLFKGFGDLGSRLTGGVSSATRYIQLSPVIANYIFIKEDNPILINQRFEGHDIEPKFYVPIVPMLLVNGSNSPSIGFSHLVMPRNLKDIITNIKRKLNGLDYIEMLPYYRGFKGTIHKGNNERQFIIKGVAEVVNTSTVKITELPLGYNMLSYRNFLLKLKKDKKISDFIVENDTKKDIFLYTVKFERKILNELSGDSLLKYLNLISTKSDILFLNNADNQIVEFNNVYEIMDKYIDIRLEYYKLRKEYNINKMQLDIDIQENKIRFINDVLSDVINFKNKNKKEIEKELNNLGYLKNEDSFDYLLNMSYLNSTKDNLNKLISKRLDLIKELSYYKQKDIADIWNEELDELSKKLDLNLVIEKTKIKTIDNKKKQALKIKDIENEVTVPGEPISLVNNLRRQESLKNMNEKKDLKKLF